MVDFTGDSIWGITVSIIVLIIVIGNAIYLNGVREELNNPNNTLNLSVTGADIFFYVDIFLAIGMTIYLIYNIWKIATTSTERKTIKQKVVKVSTTPLRGRAYQLRSRAPPAEVVYKQGATEQYLSSGGRVREIPAPPEYVPPSPSGIPVAGPPEE